jgi:NADH-quinone oxidoreductase subunit G
VLPACSWAEAEGTYVNKKGLAQKSEKALAPKGDMKPGWLLVAELARALGYAMDWKKKADVAKAMAKEPNGVGAPAEKPAPEAKQEALA